MKSDQDTPHASAASAKPFPNDEHPLPVAREEEPESLHPSVGESWAPKGRDDHMNGLRNSSPALRPATKVQADERPKAGFFGSISDAFDLSHAHRTHAVPPAKAPTSKPKKAS